MLDPNIREVLPNWVVETYEEFFNLAKEKPVDIQRLENRWKVEVFPIGEFSSTLLIMNKLSEKLQKTIDQVPEGQTNAELINLLVAYPLLLLLINNEISKLRQLENQPEFHGIMDALKSVYDVESGTFWGIIMGQTQYNLAEHRDWIKEYQQDATKVVQDMTPENISAFVEKYLGQTDQMEKLLLIIASIADTIYLLTLAQLFPEIYRKYKDEILKDQTNNGDA